MDRNMLWDNPMVNLREVSMALTGGKENKGIDMDIQQLTPRNKVLHRIVRYNIHPRKGDASKTRVRDLLTLYCLTELGLDLSWSWIVIEETWEAYDNPRRGTIPFAWVISNLLEKKGVVPENEPKKKIAPHDRRISMENFNKELVFERRSNLTMISELRRWRRSETRNLSEREMSRLGRVLAQLRKRGIKLGGTSGRESPSVDIPEEASSDHTPRESVFEDSVEFSTDEEEVGTTGQLQQPEEVEPTRKKEMIVFTRGPRGIVMRGDEPTLSDPHLSPQPVEETPRYESAHSSDTFYLHDAPSGNPDIISPRRAEASPVRHSPAHSTHSAQSKRVGEGLGTHYTNISHRVVSGAGGPSHREERIEGTEILEAMTRGNRMILEEIESLKASMLQQNSAMKSYMDLRLDLLKSTTNAILFRQEEMRHVYEQEQDELRAYLRTQHSGTSDRVLPDVVRMSMWPPRPLELSSERGTLDYTPKEVKERYENTFGRAYRGSQFVQGESSRQPPSPQHHETLEQITNSPKEGEPQQEDSTQPQQESEQH